MKSGLNTASARGFSRLAASGVFKLLSLELDDQAPSGTGREIGEDPEGFR
jgi:hypothetical protein